MKSLIHFDYRGTHSQGKGSTQTSDYKTVFERQHLNYKRVIIIWKYLRYHENTEKKHRNTISITSYIYIYILPSGKLLMRRNMITKLYLRVSVCELRIKEI